MKVLPYAALARNFPKAWAVIETNGEEVIVTRNHRPVARIVPETEGVSASDMFGDLHGVLGEDVGAALTRKLAEVRQGKGRKGTLRELRNLRAS